MGGRQAGEVFEGRRRFALQVRFEKSARTDIEAIKSIPIAAPDGTLVPLGQLAELTIEEGPAQVSRERAQRRITVEANVRGRDLGSVVADVETRINKVEFPLEYYPEVVGEYKERQAAQRTMVVFSTIAAVGVFILLFTSFKSGRLATLSFLTLPSAVVGGVLAVYFGDGVISLGSLVGFLTVLGIAARNVIMMINHFQHLERYEGERVRTWSAVKWRVPLFLGGLAAAIVVVAILFNGMAEPQRE